MPQIVIDCSENILKIQKPNVILKEVFDTAFTTGLFKKSAIKVRLNPCQYFYSENPEANFIHVFASIMEGRTSAQKQQLSEAVIKKLTILFPNLPIISMNVIDIEKASYYNKTMI